MGESLLDRPLKAGDLELPNRIVMAPMTRNRAGAGHVPGEFVAEYYRQRAGAGLIVTEATQVSPQGIGYPNTPGIHSPEQVAGWAKVVDAVHRAGGRIVLQLWHCGRISHPLWQEGGALPVAPSAVAPRGRVYTPEGMKDYVVPRALEPGEIAGIVADYARGTSHAKQAGFDGVEIHGANGYLPDQFLRDGSNRRTDRYGGGVENRSRFLLEIVEACASAWSASRVGVRLSPSGTFNDMSDRDPVGTFGEVLERLSAKGIAYAHVVEPDDGDRRHAGPGWTPAPAAQLRRRFRGTYVAAGGFDRARAEEILAAGHADAVAFARLFISNPDLPERFRRGAPLQEADPKTFYGGDARGYTDYPALEAGR
jgi:N-ethylmaleimide reductase